MVRYHQLHHLRSRPVREVFDAAKVDGNLVVRRARRGEARLALDGKTTALDDSCAYRHERGVSRWPG